MTQGTTRVYRSDMHGAVDEPAPENPWERMPRGIQERVLYEEFLAKMEERMRAQLVAAHRVVDLAPPAAVLRRLHDLYSVDRHAPAGDVLLAEMAEFAKEALQHRWTRKLDHLEDVYRNRKGD